MLANFLFVELTPAAPGSAVSSQPVANAASYMPRGVCGPLDDFSAVSCIFDIPSNTTGGTLDISLQTSPNGGTDWYDTIRLPSIANAAPAVAYAAPLSLATTTSAPVQVGKNGAVALAPNRVVNGAFSDRARLVMTAGGGAGSSITIKVKLAAQRVRMREHGT